MTRKIYGVSSKFNFGVWEHNVSVFDNKLDAGKWLNTEEYDFRERELMTKTDAIKLVGRNAVELACQNQINTMYRTIKELNEDEREELKEALYQKLLDDGTIDIDEFDGVTDKMLDEHYAGIDFTEEDFFYNLQTK